MDAPWADSFLRSCLVQRNPRLHLSYWMPTCVLLQNRVKWSQLDVAASKEKAKTASICYMQEVCLHVDMIRTLIFVSPNSFELFYCP
jgi:hypothetical protein